jgi:hypothetical protein
MEIAREFGRIVSISPVGALINAAFKCNKVGLDPDEIERIKKEKELRQKEKNP